MEARAVSAVTSSESSAHRDPAAPRMPGSGSRRAKLWIGWTLAALLFAASWFLQRGETAGIRERGMVQRWLGPIAVLAARLEWVRADLALRAGDQASAYARAETALDLEPENAEAWIFLAHHFIFERASFAREVDLAERKSWVETGLDVLERGRRASSDPAKIMFYRGGVFEYLAAIPDADRPWKGDRRAALLEAARSFEEALALGDEVAREYAALARRAAEGGR
jgi:hypothetical protein